MIFETQAGDPLNTYYRSRQGWCGGNCDSTAQKVGFSPYEGDETVYYFFKHIALPGIAIVFFVVVLLFRMFTNFFSDILQNILLTIGVLFFLSVGRELVRGMKYKIKQDVIYEPGPYVFNREAASFTHTLNEIVETKYKIGFVGDIMKMNKFNLEFHPDIKAFFDDVNVIVGNLEGIVSNLSCPTLKQSHPRSILTQLESLLSGNTKWLLCLSNNHSEDFSSIQFNRSLHRIQRRDKFDAFGRDDVSFIHNATHDIHFFSLTEWSNQKTFDYTLKYDNTNPTPFSNLNRITKLIDNNKFNILLPHWGYENEKYVRSRFQSDAKALMIGINQNYSRLQEKIRNKRNRIILPNKAHHWDLIFAHHPHVLQPIITVTDKIVDNQGETIYDTNGNPILFKKLAVFSAGNFTSGANIIRKKKHISGIILKCNIGPLVGYEDKLVIGKMEWRRTKNHKIRIGNVRTKRVCIDCEKYRTYNRQLFIGGLIYLMLYVTMWIFNSIII